MKLIKNIVITIAALFVIGSMDAKTASEPTTPRAPQLDQPGETGNTYKNLIDEVRNMSQSAVLIEDNTAFKPEFITFVKDKASNLSETELKALLQAGINLYADWTGTPDQNKKKLSNFNKQIDTSTKETLSAATTITETEAQKAE